MLISQDRGAEGAYRLSKNSPVAGEEDREISKLKSAMLGWKPLPWLLNFQGLTVAFHSSHPELILLLLQICSFLCV